MKGKTHTLLSLLMLFVFVFSLVATMHSTAEAHIWYCCSYEPPGCERSHGVRHGGQEPDVCSVQACIQYINEHNCPCHQGDCW